MAVRRNARELPESELSRIREAFSSVKNIGDERGYEYFAGIHGLPLPVYCQHGTLLFLPWHRAYLYFFELALQEQVTGVGIPWWDWTSDISHQLGIPPAYTDAQANGGENALLAATVGWPRNLINTVRQRLPGTLTAQGRTRRDPDLPDELPRKETIDDILEAPTFEDFSLRMENVHNDVHGWVAGTMSAVPTAAYDPIFWAHHSMIDRLWYLWQMRHAGMDPPASIMGAVLAPFTMTTAQTLSIASLGYEYAVQVI